MQWRNADMDTGERAEMVDILPSCSTAPDDRSRVSLRDLAEVDNAQLRAAHAISHERGWGPLSYPELKLSS